MVKGRKVIFWGREDLLGCSVEMFLSARKEWEVIRLCSGQNDEALMDVIALEKPDVALLYLDKDEGFGTLPMQLIQCYPGLKVIALNLDSNEIEIYNRKKLCIGTISDLLSAVEGKA